MEIDWRKVIFGAMKLSRKIKEAFGIRLLHNEMEPVRLRKGFNFNSAESVGIIYKDIDEAFYKNLHEYANFLKSNFNISSVMLLAFVDEPVKKLPAWQTHKLESEFFSRPELNWHQRPINGISTFIERDFDILIDFSGGNVLPLNFVLKESRAKMKVGMRGTRAERYCDFILNMGNQFGMENFVEQLNSYLSNPKIK
jgi:hypothetical protein